MLNPAIKYQNFGLKTLPVNSDKTPALKVGWKDAVLVPETHRGAYGIGIIAGKKSGNIECLDFDNKAKKRPAKQVLEDFSELVYDLKQQISYCLVSTPSGGYHILYRCEAEITGNKKLAMYPVYDADTGKHRPVTLIETRGQDGYFVAAPTPGYKILKGDYTQLKPITKEQRAELLSAARSLNEYIEKPVISIHEKQQGPGTTYNQDPQALYNTELILNNAGWQQAGKAGQWRRPGKKAGTSASLLNVSGQVCFYVFSTNAYPFEQNNSYSPFAVKAYLEFGGDFGRCAKELAEIYNTVSHEPRKGPKTAKNAPKTKQNFTKSELDELLKVHLVDTTKELGAEPVYVSIRQGVKLVKLCTPKNFSVIKGKQKSKKSFLQTMITAACVAGDYENLFFASLPTNRPEVITIDTEQGMYDVQKLAKRVEKLSSTTNPDNYTCFKMRGTDVTPLKAMIEHLVKNYAVGFMVIDQVADLVKDVNDMETAYDTLKWLEGLTEEYNMHIMCIIHENKSKMDSSATGHLGSFLVKKAETVIQIARLEENKDISIVSAADTRGRGFENFGFFIDSYGMPKIKSEDEFLEIESGII